MAKMKAIINRKGIFFTFIAITIMAVFIIVFTPQAEISLQKDVQSIKTRVYSLDNYVSDLEKNYLGTVLRVTSYKTLLSMIYYMNSTGSYIPDFDSAFSEVMLTGKINGVAIDTITGKKIMENNTLTDFNNRITLAAKGTLNVNTTIIITNISAFQSKPWEIESRMAVNFTVTSNVAEWRRNSIISAVIGIEGLPDPYYLVNTNKAYTNKIKRSSVEFNKWNITKVRENIRNGSYVHWENSDAPNFLMRFSDTIISSGCCGIESLANPNKMSPSDQRESYADYLLWSHKFANNCTQIYNITGLWDEFRYFKLDLDHVSRYNITSQDAVRTC